MNYTRIIGKGLPKF